MKITHLWLDYSPNLFDRSHPLCLSHGLDSEVVCEAFIENGAAQLPGTFLVRQRSPAEMNTTSIPGRLVSRLRRPVDHARFARLTRRRTQAARPDVLHVHFGTTAAVLEERGALPDLPTVVSFYGVDISESLQVPEILRAYRSIFAKAAILHVLCDEAQRRLTRAGCPPEKIRIGNLPVSLEEIPDIGVEATGTTRFLIPARFVEKKGHRVLLTAFKRLVDGGLPVSLTCFGYGPAAWLQRFVADLGLGGSVRIVDNGQTGAFMAEYVRVLREHDVVLAPSVRSRSGDDEAGPALTLVMAQAAGKPVIVSNFPGSERSVVDGEHGVVVPAGDAGGLHDAMAGVAGDVARWERFGRAGRRLALEKFSDAAYWANLLAWYRSAAQPRS